MKYSFFVHGKPKSYNRFSKSNAKNMKKYKDNLVFEARKNVNKIIEKTAIINIDFFFKIPKRLSVRHPDTWPLYIHNAPDISLLIHFLIKNMEGILFNNSKNIVNVNAKKYYCLSPRSEGTKIEIKTINN